LYFHDNFNGAFRHCRELSNKYTYYVFLSLFIGAAIRFNLPSANRINQ